MSEKFGKLLKVALISYLLDLLIEGCRVNSSESASKIFDDCFALYSFSLLVEIT